MKFTDWGVGVEHERATMAGYHVEDRCCCTAALDPDDGPRDLDHAWVGDSVVRNLLVPVEAGNEITTFIRLECLPDTVDLRGSKGK
jgi:hypothetical protein